jgi:PAS domain S-box-containing protein
MTLALAKATPVPVHGPMALVKAVERLATAGSLDDIIAVVRETARDIAGSDGVCFVLKDGDFCHYVEEHAIGPLWKGRRFPLTACISGWCMLRDEPAVIPDIYLDPRIPHDAYRPTFVKSLVMVPVKTTECIAAIGTYWAETRDFSDEELMLIDALGRSTAAAIAACALRNSLSEGEHRLALALDAGGLGAWEIDLNTGKMIATDAAKAIFGLRPEAVFTRQTLLQAIHPGDRDHAALALECASLVRRDEEYRVVSGDGERWIELKGRRIDDESGLPSRVIGVVRDVTARHTNRQRLDSLRTELLRVARANDLGAMASALAHELNQPLAAATNYLSAAERLLTRDPAQAQTAIVKAQAQFVRTRDIIQRIRGFVGQGQSEHKPEDLETVCREVLELARMTAVFDGVTLYFQAETGLPAVAIDKVQVQQVLLNLLRNAREALAGRDNPRITITAARDGEMVRVSVSDTGPGLAPEIVEHLFQPFQTTKEGGMGVGLSLCRKIIDAHGGKLWHEPGNPGAVFCFTLPVA